MKEQLRTKVTHFRNSNFEKTADPAKTCVRKIYVDEKILRIRNCRRKFIKNLVPEKCKENI